MEVDSISDAIPNTSAMIVLSSTGTAILAAGALAAAGRMGTAVVTVNPATGEPSMSKTPDQIMTPEDPAAKLEIGTPAVGRTMQAGISTPQMGMNR